MITGLTSLLRLAGSLTLWGLQIIMPGREHVSSSSPNLSPAFLLFLSHISAVRNFFFDSTLYVITGFFKGWPRAWSLLMAFGEMFAVGGLAACGEAEMGKVMTENGRMGDLRYF